MVAPLIPIAIGLSLLLSDLLKRSDRPQESAEIRVAPGRLVAISNAYDVARSPEISADLARAYQVRLDPKKLRFPLLDFSRPHCLYKNTTCPPSYCGLMYSFGGKCVPYFDNSEREYTNYQVVVKRDPAFHDRHDSANFVSANVDLLCSDSDTKCYLITRKCTALIFNHTSTVVIRSHRSPLHMCTMGTSFHKLDVMGKLPLLTVTSITGQAFRYDFSHIPDVAQLLGDNQMIRSTLDTIGKYGEKGYATTAVTYQPVAFMSAPPSNPLFEQVHSAFHHFVGQLTSSVSGVSTSIDRFMSHAGQIEKSFITLIDHALASAVNIIKREVTLVADKSFVIVRSWIDRLIRFVTALLEQILPSIVLLVLYYLVSRDIVISLLISVILTAIKTIL